MSRFNTTECSDPVVLMEDTLITCLAQPNLGPSQIIVTVDGIDSLPSNATFIHYDNAGTFEFEQALFMVSETEYLANVTIVRLGAPPFPSPINVSIQAFDGTAISGRHFVATNTSMYLESEENSATFQIGITFQDFLPDVLRKGAEDDVDVNLRITDVDPLHGDADIGNGTAVLRIKALCQVVSHVCVADWNVLTNEIAYFRVDEL